MMRLLIALNLATASFAIGQENRPNTEALHIRAARIKPGLEQVLTEFQARTFVSQEDVTMPYLLFVPKNMEQDNLYPLVLFLHGWDGHGSDNLKQISGGNLWGSRVWVLPENQKEFPCFVVAPQSSATWSKDQLAVVIELLDQIDNEFPIDKQRKYVTGQSMGGLGTWRMVSSYPDVFAAGVPICGYVDQEWATAIATHNVGIWAFHGDADETVPVSRSRGMIAAIKKAGGKPRYTEYPGVGHASWMGAYTEEKLFSWLFSQKRK